MDWDLKITDLEGSTPEHSAVIVNFVAAVRHQLKNSTCYVYSDNVQYRFKDNQGNNKIVIPDASINCRTKSRRGNTFTDAPRFVMEVCHHQQKIMTGQRKCSCIVSRRLKSIGSLTGVKKQLKSMNWIMRGRFPNTIF